MILYRLQCECGHDFDAWFRDSATYDRQEKRGQVSCPECQSTHVGKAIMAPRLSGDHRKKGERDNLPAPSGEIAVPDEVKARALARQILRSMRRMRRYAEENFENVGENFAEEARAIGKAAQRRIHHVIGNDARLFGVVTCATEHVLRKILRLVDGQSDSAG